MNWFAAKSFINYFFTARHRKGYGIHSPFLFNLITKGLNKKLNIQVITPIEKLRKQLLKSKEIIEVNDFGAGSKIMKSSQRKVSQIAKTSITRKKYAQLLAKLVHYFSLQSQNNLKLLELGTSLGITTLYLASHDNTEVFTVEGAASIGKIAQANFKKMNAKNIHLIISEFSEALNSFSKQKEKFDLIFIDGNHRYEATLNYFEKIKLLSHKDTVLIFDDIHWSKEMQKAWQEIYTDDAVTLSLDVFQFGIVFFKKELSKQHFVLRY